MNAEELQEIKREAEAIIALASGPWSHGENLPGELRDAMIVRSEHLRKHAEKILQAAEALEGIL